MLTLKSNHLQHLFPVQFQSHSSPFLICVFNNFICDTKVSEIFSKTESNKLGQFLTLFVFLGYFCFSSFPSPFILHSHKMATADFLNKKKCFWIIILYVLSPPAYFTAFLHLLLWSCADLPAHLPAQGVTKASVPQVPEEQSVLWEGCSCTSHPPGVGTVSGFQLLRACVPEGHTLQRCDACSSQWGLEGGQAVRFGGWWWGWCCWGSGICKAQPPTHTLG